MNLEDYKDIANTGNGWVEVIKIISKHSPDGMQSKIWFESDHDIIFCPLTADDIPVDSDDGMILEALGWFLSEEYDCWCVFT